MSHTEIEQSLNDLNNLVLSGKMMDAFEKYYHDEVVMQGRCPFSNGKTARSSTKNLSTATIKIHQKYKPSASCYPCK